MPLDFSKPPQGVLKNCATEVRSIRSAGGHAVGTAIDMGGQAGGRAHALPLFSISLAKLAEPDGEPLSEAQQQGWRVIMDEQGTRKLVDHINNVGVASISGGKALSNLVRAGEVAAAVVDDGITYEPRVLEFGRLGKSALWLHAPNPSEPDRFFSLDDSPTEVSGAEFLAEATEHARTRLRPVAEPDTQNSADDTVHNFGDVGG